MEFGGVLNIELNMVLFAAGEKTEDWMQITAARYLFFDDLKLCLKHKCREAIRKHLLDLDPHSHLFGRIPQLGLPSLLTEYLLYDQTLEDDDNVMKANSEK